MGLGGEVVEQAKVLLAQLRAQQEAAAALNAALQTNDLPSLTAALEKANKVGLRSGLVQEAQRRQEALKNKVLTSLHPVPPSSPLPIPPFPLSLAWLARLARVVASLLPSLSHRATFL